jgi:acetyl esterase/lipase
MAGKVRYSLLLLIRSGIFFSGMFPKQNVHRSTYPHIFNNFRDYLLQPMKNLLFVLSLSLLISCQKNVDSVADVPLEAREMLNVAYGTDAQQKLDLYLPANRKEDSTKLLVLVHGGAWIEGDKRDFALMVATLQQRFPDYAIANINYRLATVTANHFPAQETDMKAALEHLVQKKGEYAISQKIVLLGASAGGHMATLQAYKNATPRVSAVVDFFGPVDMVALYNSIADPTNKFAMQILMGGTPASNSVQYQQSSPVNFVSAAAPPTIIFHGGMDDLVDIAQSVDLHRRLQAAGVVTELVTYPTAGHGVWSPAILADALGKMEVFIRANVR